MREVLAKRGHIAASPIEYSNLMRHDSLDGRTDTLYSRRTDEEAGCLKSRKKFTPVTTLAPDLTTITEQAKNSAKW